jgi:sulfatase maturation enzyme AslB (radical SAM superfamily)
MARETYVLHVTKACNCACKYCYEQDKTSTYTWEEVKETLDNIIKFRTSDSFGIEFLGGEPMMAWDNIRNTVIYVTNEYPNLDVDFTITTNGTIINNELIDMLKTERVHFAISMDGHPLANMFRVFKGTGTNTYNTVVRNIEALHKAGIYDLGVHITTHPWNIGYLNSSIDDLYKLGIREFGIGTVESVVPLLPPYIERFNYEMDLLSQRICNGEFEEPISVDLFNWVKPKEDVRSYIRDASGKVVAESYGRSGDDISHQDGLYDINRCDNETETSNIIYDIRSRAYNTHHERLRKLGLE